MKKIILLIFSIFLLTGAANAQSQENTAFQSGETLTYDLYFNWKFVWIKVGTASMNITKTYYNGQPAYKAYLITRGSKQADKYFVMRDTLTTYTNLSLVPQYYSKHAKEGKDYRVEDVWYSYSNNMAHLKMRYKKNNEPYEYRNEDSKYYAYDMVSMILRARSFDPSTYKEGHRINFLMAEGNKTRWRQVIYKGKKDIKMKDGNGTYKTLVFSYVEKQDDGKEKEIVRFYITDDKNHLPVCLDLNLNFGSAKAYMHGAVGVRHPLTSKKK